MATDTAAGAKEEKAEEESDRRGEEEREEEEAEGEDEAPSHLPLAPPYLLSDTSTTIDPSYIISLIRKLLPRYEKKQDAIGDCNSVKETTTTEASNDIGSHGDLTRGGTYYGDRSCIDQENPSALSHDNGKCKEIQEGSTYKCDRSSVDQDNPSALSQDNGKCQELQEEERVGDLDHVQAEATEPFETKDSWEECGSILWDLSATKTHAKLMVDNLLLEVLLHSLHCSKSLRVTEICLGIIGNLACHDDLSYAIVSKDSLVEIVLQQLFLDDSTCLSETFRLMAAGLKGNSYTAWSDALLSDQVLLRILWIIGNTLNSVLLEKCVEFFYAIINNQEVSSILLRHLIKLGLPELVTGLVAGELSKLGDESKLERSSNLEAVLLLVEALSTTDSCSQVLNSNEELLPLVCGLVKLPDKVEFAGPCISATVVIANLLENDPDLALQFKEDIKFLLGLLEMLPFVADDPQARHAFWCVMQRVLSRVEENVVSWTTLVQYAWLFNRKCQIIQDYIKSHPEPEEKLPENPDIHVGRKSSPAATSIRRIACILEKWIFEKSIRKTAHEYGGGTDGFGGSLTRLLQSCRKYSSYCGGIEIKPSL